MNSDKQRAAIALYCGWKVEDNEYKRWTSPSGTQWNYPPAYDKDLNAMHEAEKILYPDSKQSERYAEFLLNAFEIPSPFIGTGRCAFLTNHATAAQRAEAFLKTIGKWGDGA